VKTNESPLMSLAKYATPPWKVTKAHFARLANMSFATNAFQSTRQPRLKSSTFEAGVTRKICGQSLSQNVHTPHAMKRGASKTYKES